MSTDEPAGIYLVTCDDGSGPQVDESEVYNDLAFAWKMADEQQAEADAEGDAVVYGVFALVAVERPK